MSLELLPIDTKLKDGFWCSYKLSAEIKENLEISFEESPWIGVEVHCVSYFSDEFALLVKNGKVVTVYEIDWGKPQSKTANLKLQ